MSRSCISSLALALIVAVPLCCAPAQARPHPTPSPSATPVAGPEDPAITEIATREFLAWQSGTIDPRHYAPTAQQSPTPEMAKALAAYGALVKTEWLGKLPAADSPPGVSAYTYKMDCINAPVFEQLRVDADGKVSSINFLRRLP